MRYDASRWQKVRWVADLLWCCNFAVIVETSWDFETTFGASSGLELLEEIAGRAGDVDSAGNATLAVLDALDDARGFGALGAICGLGGVHDLLAVACLCNLGHGS